MRICRSTVFLIALFTLIPRCLFAQGQLPIRWVNGAMNVVKSVAYSPDGTLFAVGGTSGIQIFTVSTGALLRRLPTVESYVQIAISPDGKTLAAGGSGGTHSGFGGILETWDVATGKRIRSFVDSTGNLYPVSLGFSPNGKNLVVGNGGGSASSAQVWDAAGGSLVKYIYLKYEVLSTVYSPDGKSLAFGGLTLNSGNGKGIGTLEFRDSATGAVTQTLKTDAGIVQALAFSTDGKTLGVGGSYVAGSTQTGFVSHGVVEEWDVASKARTQSLGTSYENVNSVAFSKDGIWITATGTTSYAYTSALELWKASTGLLWFGNYGDANGSYNAVAFSPDGKTIAVGGWSGSSGGFGSSTKSSSLGFFNAATGTLANYSQLKTQATNAVAFSPSTGVLAEGGTYGNNPYGPPVGPGQPNGGGLLELRNQDTGALVKELNTTASSGVVSLGFSASGQLLVSGGNTSKGVVEEWNGTTGQLIRSLPTAATKVNAIAVSPAGNLIAVGGTKGGGFTATGYLELWNGTTGASLGTLKTNANYAVNAVAFSPNGKSLAVGGSKVISNKISGVLEVWDVASGTVSVLQTTVTRMVNTVVFSKNGLILAAGGQILSTSVPAGIECWDVSSGKRLSSPLLPATEDGINSAAFAPYSNILMAGGEFSIMSFTSASTAPLKRWNLDTWHNYSASFSRGGDLFAYVDNNSLVVAASPYYAKVASVTFAPPQVVGGTSAKVIVKLSAPAPPGGARVGVISSQTAAKAPATVVIAAGALTGTGTVTTSVVTLVTNAVITAKYAGTAGSGTLAVTP